MAAGLLALAGCSEVTGPERTIDGEQLYNQNCARCHGMDGRGLPEQPQARDLSDVRVMQNLSDEQIKRTIQMGRPPTMPAFGDQFTEASLMVLVAYVRSLSGSTGARPAADRAGAENPAENSAENEE
jgi:cbb3-type cytochrome c oxidase subunit III